jgi:hypothetical protein
MAEATPTPESGTPGLANEIDPRCAKTCPFYAERPSVVRATIRRCPEYLPLAITWNSNDTIFPSKKFSECSMAASDSALNGSQYHLCTRDRDTIVAYDVHLCGRCDKTWHWHTGT